MPLPNIPSLVNATIGKVANVLGYRPCTLTKFTAGSRAPGNLTGGTNPTSTTYAAVGAVSDYDEDEIDGTLIIVGDRKITLLAASIVGGVAPSPEDQITIVDQTGVSTTFTIVPKGVRATQTGSKFICQGRA